MTWAPLLLADASPCLRWLVLTQLLARPADDSSVEELRALRENDPLVLSLTAGQGEDGAWRGGSLPASWGDDPVASPGTRWRGLASWASAPSSHPLGEGRSTCFRNSRQTAPGRCGRDTWTARPRKPAQRRLLYQPATVCRLLGTIRTKATR